jgi:lipocalin
VRVARAAATALVLVTAFLSNASGAGASPSGGGTQRWAAGYDKGTPAFSYAVGASPDGTTVFVSGTSIYGSDSPGHAATLAYDASTGAEKWVATYSSSSNPGQDDRATRVAVSPNRSKVFVTGESSCSNCSGSSFQGWSTVAYDASTGAQLWAARYAVEGGAYSIAVSPDGSKLFVKGQESSGDASATVAYDTATGQQLWVIHSTDAPVYWDALAVSPDSSTVFVAGTARPPLRCGYHVAAYDATDGTPRWSARFPNCAGAATALALSGDGSTLFATGYGDLGSATVAYDASSGTELWATQETDIHAVNGDTRIPLAVSPDGSKVFVLGYDCEVSLCADQPFVTVAYDASTGTRLWASRYDSGGDNYPSDLAVSPDGSQVFVTGQEQLPCYSPCVTTPINAPVVAYDAKTGNEAWVADYPNNNAWALAVSPDGSNVYLAGTFTTSAAASSTTLCAASACGYSTASYDTRPGPGTAQDRDPSIRYNGWGDFFDKSAVGGAYRASDVRGDSATYRTPKTTRVVWLTHRGPKQGRATVLIDGHSKGTVDLYSRKASAGSFTFKGLALARHTIQVKVLGTKNPSAHGTWVAVDGFKVGGNIKEETAVAIRYDTWAGTAQSAATGGSYRKSGSSKAKLSFTFTGRSIAWVTATGPTYGRARVVIDGVAHTVDLYRRTRRWRARISYTGLPPRTHHITLTPLGTKDAASTSTRIVFDAFVVRS